jgi:hypothetical protein
MDKELETALLATGAFDQDDIEMVDVAEQAHGPIANWGPDKYADAFGTNKAKQIIAQQAVAKFKAGPVVELAANVVLPDRPPYLGRGTLGEAIGYDPSDPSQYWTDPATGEMWRWDGKGRGEQQERVYMDHGRSELRSTVAQYPHGKPRRVVLVRHTSFDGVRIPDEQEAHDANAAGYDWFHHGYNCWITDGGKPTGDVSPEVRQRFLDTRERMQRQGRRAPLINRSRSFREVAA